MQTTKEKIEEKERSGKESPKQKAQSILAALREEESRARAFRQGFIWSWTEAGRKCVSYNEKPEYTEQIFVPNEDAEEAADRAPRLLSVREDDPNIARAELVGGEGDYRLWKESFLCEKQSAFSEIASYYTLEIKDARGHSGLLRCISANRKAAELALSLLEEAEAGCRDAAPLFEDIYCLLGSAGFFGKIG